MEAPATDLIHIQPLHAQLRTQLIASIRDGSWQPHSRIPSERELCDRFRVSRTTTRRTLSDLVHEGWLYTVIGKGTYVAPRPLKQELRPLTGFTQDLADRGIATRARVLLADRQDASEEIADRLGLLPFAPVYRLRRLRIVADRPIALQTAFLPEHLCPGLFRHDLAAGSLFAVLRTDYRLEPRRGQTTIKAGLATPTERDLLRLDDPAAVLRTFATAHLDDGTVVEYCESVFHPELYELTSTALENRFAVPDATR